jgi:polygalacturonase
MKWPAALINVYEQSHVKISGKGVIDGDGKIWWDKYWALRKEYEPKGLRWAADYDCQRPRLIQIYKSSDVDLVGLELRRSGFWTVHICYSQRVHVDGTTVRNNIGGKGPSTDGIDIDSSSGVLVEHCDLDCNDDDICLKAGRDADGLRVNRPSEKIVIRDCTVRGGAAGITIGSETSGGIRDVEAYRIHVLRPVPNGHSLQVGQHARRHHRKHRDSRHGHGGRGHTDQHHFELEPELQLRQDAGGDRRTRRTTGGC